MKTTVQTNTTNTYRCELTAEEINKIILDHVRNNAPEFKDVVGVDDDRFILNIHIIGGCVGGAVIVVQTED